jgi:hypothetical protein
MPLASKFKVLLLTALISAMLPIFSAQAIPKNAAIVAISNAYPELNPSLLFISNHPSQEFGGYTLATVSTLEILPPPQWVVASKTVRGKIQTVLLDPVERQSWNKIVKGAKLNLLTRKDYAKFPVQFLKITAPALKAKWRFSASELAKLSSSGRHAVRQGWRSQSSAKGIIINFFSSDLVGKFQQWRLVISKQGAIRSIKQIPVR